ncbi:formate/nitrite transporter family protein [Litoreibacter janthinus]|uniref:Formate/nitrite transporter FocA, FNT family n=1 Tax=Litoreibacter janthinus TaxID=670154 RepID=A0A1I6HKQ7_9RHOB|nr:formate/nitrite transporter family protein [Litoreibacter janthinus]SFR55022.1 Formate/nitrite transporter FocA, FNT family [Litoreibacter janthinus]
MAPKSRQQKEKHDRSIEDAQSLGAKLIFEVVRREGEEELERPIRSLMWSGVAAGIMISLSVLGEGIFRTYLPDAPWRHLLENLGYSLGFLVVILGGMQLFTENTITTVLPLMSRPSLRMLGRVARLWAVVLMANVVGAFAIAILYAHTPALPPELLPALMDLSHHATGMPASEGFFRAIPAGMIVAAIVWMLPNSEGFGFWVVLIFTWLIAAGDFTHVVAGSVEMALLMVTGQLTIWPALMGFFFPVLLGNIVGGTVVFSLITYGQVRHELTH